MSRRLLLGRRALLGTCGATALTWSHTATWAATAAGRALPSAEVQALLRQVQEAGQQRSFAGVYVTTGGGGMSSSRIVHVAEGRDQFERVEALDGQRRTAYRHNDVVHTFWPKVHEVVIQQREQVLDFPSPVASAVVAGLPMYQVQWSGADRVAGQEVQVVTLIPRDLLRYGQRWWLHRPTHLLLRADTLGDQGDAIESTAFTEIQLNSKTSSHDLLQEMNRLDGYKVLRPSHTRTELEREGWRLREAVPGFDPIVCMRRPAHATAHRALAASAAPTNRAGGSMLQSIFSDGLTHVSLFIEPYDPQAHVSEAAAVMGATHVLPLRLGEWWVTLVGDVPSATLRLFAQSLERRKA